LNESKNPNIQNWLKGVNIRVVACIGTLNLTTYLGFALLTYSLFSEAVDCVIQTSTTVPLLFHAMLYI